MMVRYTFLAADDVHDLTSFGEYIQQTLGTPHITVKDKQILGKRVKDLFAEHPTMTWKYLTRLVDWAKDKKRRPARAYTVMSYLNFAWRDRYLPDLPSQAEADFTARLDAALRIEHDPDWHQRLLMSIGNYQVAALEEWEAERRDVAIVEDLPVPEQLTFDSLKKKEK